MYPHVADLYTGRTLAEFSSAYGSRPHRNVELNSSHDSLARQSCFIDSVLITNPPPVIVGYPVVAKTPLFSANTASTSRPARWMGAKKVFSSS